MLIMEDDIVISRRFRNLAPELFQKMRNRRWDILLLGFFPSHGRSFHPYYGYTSDDFYRGVALRRPAILPGGMHFYVVNGRILKRLIQYLEEMLGQRSAGWQQSLCDSMDIAYVDDAFYQFSRENPDVAYYAAMPSLAFQRFSRRGRWHNAVKTQMKILADQCCPKALEKIMEMRTKKPRL